MPVKYFEASGHCCCADMRLQKPDDYNDIWMIVWGYTAYFEGDSFYLAVSNEVKKPGAARLGTIFTVPSQTPSSFSSTTVQLEFDTPPVSANRGRITFWIKAPFINIVAYPWQGRWWGSIGDLLSLHMRMRMGIRMCICIMLNCQSLLYHCIFLPSAPSKVKRSIWSSAPREAAINAIKKTMVLRENIFESEVQRSRQGQMQRFLLCWKTVRPNKKRRDVSRNSAQTEVKCPFMLTYCTLYARIPPGSCLRGGVAMMVGGSESSLCLML